MFTRQPYESSPLMGCVHRSSSAETSKCRQRWCSRQQKARNRNRLKANIYGNHSHSAYVKGHEFTIMQFARSHGIKRFYALCWGAISTLDYVYYALSAKGIRMLFEEQYRGKSGVTSATPQRHSILNEYVTWSILAKPNEMGGPRKPQCDELCYI